jgi:hypothetical protein
MLQEGLDSAAATNTNLIAIVTAELEMQKIDRSLHGIIKLSGKAVVSPKSSHPNWPVRDSENYIPTPLKLPAASYGECARLQ